MRWNAFSAFWASRSTWRGWLTSVGTATAGAPAARRAGATSPMSWPRRAATTAAAPCRASSRAVPLPKPLEAPVTTTTLPATLGVVMRAGAPQAACRPLRLERGHLRLQALHQVGKAPALHQAGELHAIVAEQAGAADVDVHHAPAAVVRPSHDVIDRRLVAVPGDHGRAHGGAIGVDDVVADDDALTIPGVQAPQVGAIDEVHEEADERRALLGGALGPRPAERALGGLLEVEGLAHDGPDLALAG